MKYYLYLRIWFLFFLTSWNLSPVKVNAEQSIVYLQCAVKEVYQTAYRLRRRSEPTTESEEEYKWTFKIDYTGYPEKRAFLYDNSVRNFQEAGPLFVYNTYITIVCPKCFSGGRGWSDNIDIDRRTLQLTGKAWDNSNREFQTNSEITGTCNTINPPAEGPDPSNRI